MAWLCHLVAGTGAVIVDNHGAAFGWGFGGLIAGVAYAWPANCVGQTPFGPHSVDYSAFAEARGLMACTNVFGLPRAELNQLEMAAAGVFFAVLLGALYEMYESWRSPSGTAD